MAWERQTKYLAETGKYTVLIFENRGMGLSDAPGGLYSTSQMARDVIDLLDHFGWKDKVHIDGVSMGGMIALELATTWPERVASLVLTSTTSGGQIPPVKYSHSFFYYHLIVYSYILSPVESYFYIESNDFYQ